jgi:hypothetical protein
MLTSSSNDANNSAAAQFELLAHLRDRPALRPAFGEFVAQSREILRSRGGCGLVV